jgi:hypothetical protein
LSYQLERKPSHELLSLVDNLVIKYNAVRTLFEKIVQQSKAEGFGYYELKLIVKERLKGAKLTERQIRYYTDFIKEAERAEIDMDKSSIRNRRDGGNDDKNVLSHSSDVEERVRQQGVSSLPTVSESELNEPDTAPEDMSKSQLLRLVEHLETRVSEKSYLDQPFSVRFTIRDNETQKQYHGLINCYPLKRDASITFNGDKFVQVRNTK